MPLVSIIMPSYNHAKFISYAIESILQQDFTDFELIIIDDSSKDNSTEVIDGFRKRDKRIKAIYHDSNKGFYKTYNDGLSASQGRYIAIIDSDDMWTKNKLSEQIKVLDSDKNLIVWSEGEIIDEEGSSTGEKFTERHGASDKKKSGHILEDLLKNNYIFGSSLIAATEILRNTPFPEELKYLGDWLFFLKLAEGHEYFFIDKPLTKYRIHRTSSNKDTSGYLKDHLKIYQIFMTKYKKVISKDIKSSWYAQIAGLHKILGREFHADFYIFKRFLVDPLNNEAKHDLTVRLEARYKILYRLLTKLLVFSRKVRRGKRA